MTYPVVQSDLKPNHNRHHTTSVSGRRVGFETFRLSPRLRFASTPPASFGSSTLGGEAYKGSCDSEASSIPTATPPGCQTRVTPLLTISLPPLRTSLNPCTSPAHRKNPCRASVYTTACNHMGSITCRSSKAHPALALIPCPRKTPCHHSFRIRHMQRRRRSRQDSPPCLVTNIRRRRSGASSAISAPYRSVDSTT